ncbi:MAG TPA: hypothetical protein VMV54_00815, partial [Acidocella sp.]|nr:hypothetical protein [Acidocella sp.]
MNEYLSTKTEQAYMDNLPKNNLAQAGAPEKPGDLTIPSHNFFESQDPRPAGPWPTAILVLGMHRSGISALSGMLGLLGAAVPDDFPPGREDRQKGYFDGRRIV